jgi:drug/metabolite transporter (DMT)-like permease
MDGTLFGIPYFTLGLVCLGLAVLWYYVWPKDRTPEPLKQLPEYKPRPAWMQSVLRWFHALAWVMLAATCWFLDAAQTTLASASALIAGFMYVMFIVAVIKDGQRRKALEHESLNPPSNRQSGR